MLPVIWIRNYAPIFWDPSIGLDLLDSLPIDSISIILIIHFCLTYRVYITSYTDVSV